MSNCTINIEDIIDVKFAPKLINIERVKLTQKKNVPKNRVDVTKRVFFFVKGFVSMVLVMYSEPLLVILFVVRFCVPYHIPVTNVYLKFFFFHLLFPFIFSPCKFCCYLLLSTNMFLILFFFYQTSVFCSISFFIYAFSIFIYRFIFNFFSCIYNCLSFYNAGMLLKYILFICKKKPQLFRFICFCFQF